MRKQQALLPAILFAGLSASLFNVALASDKIANDNAAIKTTLADTTLSSAHPPATELQPFWTDAQAKQKALEAKYKNEIVEKPESKQAYTRLAGLYLINNKTSNAIDAYQDAIIHDSKNPKLFAAISIAYLHQSKFAMAKAMADEALRLDSSLTQVKKINEYIVAKEAAIKAASNVSLDSATKQGATLGAAPKDAMHGSKSSVLQVSKPLEWVDLK